MHGAVAALYAGRKTLETPMLIATLTHQAPAVPQAHVAAQASVAAQDTVAAPVSAGPMVAKKSILEAYKHHTIDQLNWITSEDRRSLKTFLDTEGWPLIWRSEQTLRNRNDFRRSPWTALEDNILCYGRDDVALEWNELATKLLLIRTEVDCELRYHQLKGSADILAEQDMEWFTFAC